MEGVAMTRQPLFLSLLVIAHVVCVSPALASDAEQEGIGFYTAVSGRVEVTHPGAGRIVPVRLHDQVMFKDVIETKDDSRTKAFFQDDSVLTVGTNSRVEINEYIYNPDDNVRRAIVRLLQGQVRALVSKVFKANGSKFEVHTPTAVAAARGTYFTVWVENGQSGIINIGEKGRVDFTSGGVTVTVEPGYFSVAREGQAPSIPMEHHLDQQTVATADGQNVIASSNRNLNAAVPSDAAELQEAAAPTGLAEALASVERTLMREEWLLESPSELLQALKLDTQIMTTLAGLSRLTTASLENTATVDGTVNGTSSTTVLGQVRVDVEEYGSNLLGLGAGTSNVTAAVGSVTVGPATVGPVSVGQVSLSPVSVGPVSIGPVSVGPISLSPLSVGPLVAAPAVVVPTVTLPTVTVTVPTVVPLPPVTIAPVTVVPATPVITVPLTPPAVISGALGLLKP
jgi:FecR protein